MWPPPRIDRRSLFVACCLAALLAAGYVHLAVTRCAAWARLERRCLELSARAASYKEKAAHKDELGKLVDKAEEQFGDLELTLSPKRYIPSLLRQLSHLAEETDCALTGFEPASVPRAPTDTSASTRAKPDVDAGADVRSATRRVPVTLRIEGGFKALHEFLRKLPEQPKVIAVQDVRLTVPAAPEDTAEDKPASDESPEHKVMMELQTLTYVFPPKPGEKDEYTDDEGSDTDDEDDTSDEAEDGGDSGGDSGDRMPGDGEGTDHPSSGRGRGGPGPDGIVLPGGYGKHHFDHRP